ncbi:hypothetical protein IAR50_001598 [Cryptococcus sp. DSM 104548]
MRTLALALLGTALALPSPRISSVRQPGSNARPSQHRDTLANSSSATVPPTTTAPKNNLWNLLTNDEAAEIISYLHNQTTLNLTAATDAGDWDNTVLMVDVLPPNKTNALLYLDGNGTRPERYAYASFLSGATEEPYVQDLVVSPISVSGETTYYSNTFGTSAADAKIRVYNADDNTDSLTDIALSMKDIVPDLLNATIDTAEDFADNFHFWGIGPLWHELDEDGNDRVDYWVHYQHQFSPSNESLDRSLASHRLHFQQRTPPPPRSLFTMRHHRSRQVPMDAQRYLLRLRVLHLYQRFPCGLAKPDFIKLVPVYDGDWTSTDRAGEDLPIETRAPLMSVQLNWSRFKLDKEERYVE